METSDSMSESVNMSECLDSVMLGRAQVETREMGQVPPNPILLRQVKEPMFGPMSPKSSISLRNIEWENKPVSNWSLRLPDSSAKIQTSQHVREPSRSTSTSWRSTPSERTFMTKGNVQRDQNQQESSSCHTTQLLEDKDMTMEDPAEDIPRLLPSLMMRETESAESSANQTCLGMDIEELKKHHSVRPGPW